MGKTGASAAAAITQPLLASLTASSRRQGRELPVAADRPGEGTAARLPYNPAFDGIRGLAVAAVLLFHHGVSWMRGGYLGVSTFFTLSGFLITSLLLAEWDQAGTVRLGRFWARRIRRLLPASALTLLGIVLLVLVVDQPWERSLRGDVLAALFQVANWRFLLDNRSYSELFADPSPVLHFWSLAIEEQFYWLFPLGTVGVLALVRGSRRDYGATLGLAIAASALLSLALGPDHRDAVYYGTFTRMAEILAGALLAVVLPVVGGSGPLGDPTSSTARRRMVGAVGGLALAASLFAWVTVDQTDAGLYRGGLLAYAAVSAALVGAAAWSRSLQGILGWGPLRALGLVSYGTYLFHWPIYLVLDSDRTGLPAGGWALGAVRIALSLALATTSFLLLERPVRTGRWPDWVPAPWSALPVRLSPRVPGAALAGGALATVALAAVVVPWISSPPPVDPFAAAQERNEELIAALPASVPRAMFFGDSSALMIGAGVGSWGLDTERLADLGGVTNLGCGIARGGLVRQSGSAGSMPEEPCDWSTTWPEEIAHQRAANPRIAVVLTGTWDVVDRRLPGDDRWRGPGDPAFDRYLRDELAGATELLVSEGLTVVWLTTPPLDFGRNVEPRPPRDPADAPPRVARLNELIRQTAADHEGVAVVDLHAYFAGLPAEDDARLRPDGVHVEMTTAREVAEWLGPRILDAAVSVSGS